MTAPSERSQFLSAVSKFSPANQVDALNSLVLMIGGCAFDQKPTDSFLRLLEQDAIENAKNRSVHLAHRGDHV